MSKLFNKEDDEAKITSSQLRVLMEAIGGGELCNEDVGSLVKFDENGAVGLDELAAMVEMGGEDEEERKNKSLREAFEVFVGGEGKECITPGSLKKVLSVLGETKDEDECRDMIATFDLNGDGVLSFDEFKAMMVVV